MASMYKISFHRRLFLYLMAFAVSFLFCFVVYQYHKEKEYKIEKLGDRLQLINSEVAYYYKNHVGRMSSFIRLHRQNVLKELRITIIDLSGRVIYDSQYNALRMPNHAYRPEIQQAIWKGAGCSAIRLSTTEHVDCFYYANRIGNLIVRSALPYDMSLAEVLKIDWAFLWAMCLVAFVFAFFSYWMTHRLGHNINLLREFAKKAERGEPIDNIEPFMKDELGDVSNYIVRLYVQLRQAKDALVNEHNLVLHQEQEQIRIKRQLTQNINHELKTPVSSIEGYLETIIENPRLDERKKDDFIKKCYAQVVRMSNLLGDISTVTRMDEGGSLIERERLCLSKLINEMLDDMSLRLQEKHISVILNVPDGLFILGNQSLLQSIFRNLLDNAVAYSGCDRIFLKLLEQTEERYVFSFSDNGIGIDEIHLSRIFERFYRIDKGRSRKLGGTGLGLSIVKNAILFHGGTIVARTREGGGLEFVFMLKKNI